MQDLKTTDQIARGVARAQSKMMQSFPFPIPIPSLPLSPHFPFLFPILPSQSLSLLSPLLTRRPAAHSLIQLGVSGAM